MDLPAPLFSHPPPRLKRSPKHETLRPHDLPSSTTGEPVLSPTIRPVTDEHLKVYSTSPFPASARQRFEPPVGRALDPHPPNRDDAVSASNATDATRPRPGGPRALARVPPAAIKLPEAHRPHGRPTASQHGPGLAPRTAQQQSSPSPTPEDDARAGSGYYLPSSIIDVDRLVMDGGLSNTNNGEDRIEPPRFEPPIPPRSPARRPSPLTHGDAPPPLPRTPSRENRAGEYGNAPSSASASLAPHQDTPGTIPSVGSSGTVVRRRDFAGEVPLGYFSQFPPEDRGRPLSNPSSDSTRPRSSSEPTSPSRARVSAIDDSFVGSGSPVSPVSPELPEEEAGTPEAQLYRNSAFARSDTNLEVPSSSVPSPNVQVLAQSSSPNVETLGSSPPELPFSRSQFSIPRRPVARPHAQRWQTAMSTILSDSGSEQGRPRSPTPARFSRNTDTTRSSSAAVDFARLSSPFPLPEPLFAARDSRVTSQATPPPTTEPAAQPTIRPVAAEDLDRDLPPLPLQPAASDPPSRPSSNENPILPIQSPADASPTRRSSSLYSKPEYRDSGVQTSRRGSLFRDSLPAWARYFMTHPLSRPPSGDYASTDSLFFSALSEKFESLRNESSAMRTDSMAPPRTYSEAQRTDSGAPRTDSAARSGSSAAHIGSLDAAAAVPGRRQPRAVVDPAGLPDFFSPSKDFELPPHRSTDRSARAYYASIAAENRPRTPTVEPPTPAPASAHATSPAPPPHPSPNLRRRSSRADAHPRRHTVSGTHSPPSPIEPYPPRDSLRPPPHPRPAPPRRPPRPDPRDAITPAPGAAPQPSSSSSNSHGPGGPRRGTVSAHIDRRAARPPPGIESGDATQWSPHLYHARHSVVHRRSLFRAPSIDEKAEGSGLSRRNLQVWAFAIGFVCPVLWVVAACMPLPPRPRTPPASPRFEHDLEKTLGPADLARFENARWWRVINRVMSVVGVGIVIAIVSGDGGVDVGKNAVLTRCRLSLRSLDRRPPSPSGRPTNIRTLRYAMLC